jgi:endonuclease YncB( thermonuclease family)
MTRTVFKTIAQRPEAFVAALLLCIGFAACAHAECKGEDAGAGIVTDIQEGETLILEDGRAVRPAGILGPKRARGGPASEARGEMEKALSDLTLGKKVALRLGERKRDRYGRLLAQIMVTGDTETIWLQERLIAEGMARVISFPENRLCTAELLAKEEDARQARKGLWKSGFFAIRSAEGEDLLSRLAQSYEIVEGEVRSVADIKGKTYVNFGENWRKDFTAFISPQTAKLFDAAPAAGPMASFDAAALKGKRIRVRGWLKNFNGPSITVTHPEQIEILEQKSAAAAQP